MSESSITTRRVLPTAAGSMAAQLRAWWQRIGQLGRRQPKRLRLCESLALGERRFVAVVQFEEARFLVGGTSQSLTLLARLEDKAGAGEDRR